MTSEDTTLFSIAQIARALNKAPRIVRRWLSGIPADGSRVVAGNLTSTWEFKSLPAHAQQELRTQSEQRGFGSVAELVTGVCSPWVPVMAWNEICPEQQGEALKLQRAFLSAFDHWKEILTSRAGGGYNWRDDSALQLIASKGYQKEFGSSLSMERWQYFFQRTLERDRGAGQFHRPELFLSGNLKSSAVSRLPGVPASADPDFESLNFCISAFADPQNPSGEEIDALWMEVIELFGELSETMKPKLAKLRLLKFLWHRAPFLARSPNALRVNLERKLKMRRESECGELVLLDGRELKRGESRAPGFPQEDIDRLAWHSARNCGGRTAQAVRELGQPGRQSGLSETVSAVINAPHSRKSHVNRRLFTAVHSEAKLIAPYLLGKKAKDDATPSLRRDYSKLHSMTVLTADDFTLPVYTFVPDGKGWWILTRGQTLMMIDCRSLKIIGWSLQPERNYNSLVIRTLMNRTCQSWGLPRVWLFENGLWRNSRVVKGAPREWAEGKSWGELKPGWAKLGVRFIHAKRARSKPAELVGGLLQNLMEGTIGNCGRDERRDCPETTKRNKLAVEARRVEPHGLFLSFDAWEAELGKLIAAYNSNVQQGEILQGLSPDQAFEAYWPHDNPPARLDATCWHLLAHYVSERTVGVDGIKFRIGNQPYIYRDENTSALRGRQVLSWLDPACPEFLGVTNLAGRNPVLVRREAKVDFLAALDRDGEAGRTYAVELAKAAAHNAYPKARFNVLKAKFEPTFRKNLVSPGTAHVAEVFEEGRKQIRNEDQANLTRANRTVARARKLGLSTSLIRQGDSLETEGTEMMLRAESNLKEKPPGKGNSK